MDKITFFHREIDGLSICFNHMKYGMFQRNWNMGYIYIYIYLGKLFFKPHYMEYFNGIYRIMVIFPWKIVIFMGIFVWILMTVNGITMILGIFFSLTWIVGPSKGMISPPKKTWWTRLRENRRSGRDHSFTQIFTITINNHDYELWLTVNNHSFIMAMVIEKITNHSSCFFTTRSGGDCLDRPGCRNEESITRPGKRWPKDELERSTMLSMGKSIISTGSCSSSQTVSHNQRVRES